MMINRRRRRFVSVVMLLLLLLLSDQSNATYSFSSLRRLITQSPLPHNNIPPIPSPLPNEKDLKSSPNVGDASTNDKAKGVPVSTEPEKSNPKSSTESNIKTPVAAPTHMPVGSETNDGKKEKIDGNAKSKLDTNGSCEGSTKPCKLIKNLTACIQSLESESKGLVLLILNDGEISLKVNITVPTSPTNVVNEHVIPGKQTEKISLPTSIEQGSKILLKASDIECTLLVGSAKIQLNFLQQIPSYYKQLTPIYIAYFIFLVALIIGGTCACCRLRKRKRQDEIPYQELEMGISESASANNVETADGWDDGWDDDWDEDKAVKSPGHGAVGISANGLTARTSKQDGWGKDWDD